MDILEKSLEDILFKSLTDSPKVLHELDFYKTGHRKYLRQFHLGNYGIADIIGLTIYKGKCLNACIYELKSKQINTKTLLQASRYAKGLLHYIDTSNINFNDINIDLCLVGQYVDNDSDFAYTADTIKNLSVYTYNIDLLKGITFSQPKYNLANHGLKLFNNSFSEIKELYHLQNLWTNAE